MNFYKINGNLIKDSRYLLYLSNFVRLNIEKISCFHLIYSKLLKVIPLLTEIIYILGFFKFP